MLKTNVAELESLMKDFYVLTGIKIALFDEENNEILAYPDRAENFCAFMRTKGEFAANCAISDAAAFAECRESKKMTVYKCHAGLIEAVAPIFEQDIIIGFLMFGQVRGERDREMFLAEISEKYKSLSDLDRAISLASEIRYKNDKVILAAAKILDVCTNYVLLKKLVSPLKDELKVKITDFINDNISRELSVDNIKKEFGISRTSLYELMKSSMPDGIAAYIKSRRLSYAKRLLSETELSISAVSERVGFSDYNYFIRVFKTAFGVSPKKFRKVQSEK